MISVHDAGTTGEVGRLAAFRREFHACLTARRDALFELADALLCGDAPVRSLVELSLVGEHRRGHGSLYAALNRGRIDIERLRTAVAAVPLPRAADGRIVLAVDVTCWLRPEAHTCPQRVLCHTYGRGKDTHVGVPGWPYSFVTALEAGRTSWTAPLDARRLAPGDEAATVTAGQLRDVVRRLIAAGQWQPGDPDVWIVADAGYDGPRLAFLLADLPVQVLVRMCSDRVLRRPSPPRLPGITGRPRRHGGEFLFGDPASWGDPDAATTTDTRLYGTATARAWHRLHPRLTHRTAWAAQHGPLPIIEGTVILLTVDRLPSGATAKPVWLWWSQPAATDAEVDLLWQAFLRRFDIEHTFRMLKQTLGWTSPKLRDPNAADRWTWLVLAAYTSYASPEAPSATSAGPGNAPHHPSESRPPASGARFGTCAAKPATLPARRNPPDQDPADRLDYATATRQPATTSTSSPPPPAQDRKVARRKRRLRVTRGHAAQVKDQVSGRRGLVSHDHRRLLGRMFRGGPLLGPDGSRCPGAPEVPAARQVNGSLGEVLAGKRPGRTSDSDIILSNPFGMSVLDVAVAGAVQEVAVKTGIGQELPV